MSLIVGAPFANQPPRQNTLSSVPQLCLFKDGDVLGDLKPEVLEQGDARGVLIPDPDDQMLFRDWQRRPRIRCGGVRKHKLQSTAGKSPSAIVWL